MGNSAGNELGRWNIPLPIQFFIKVVADKAEIALKKLYTNAKLHQMQ